MKLSVRLRDEEEKALRGLRRRKVNVSALVRRALLAANDEVAAEPRSDRDIIREIIRRSPSPPRSELPARPRLDDRKGVSEFISGRLRRR